jgi:hypothetical protein
MNVLHFQNAAAWTSGTLLDLADAIDAGWEDNVKTLVATSVTLKEIQVQDLTVEDGIGTSLVVLASGANPDAVLPSNVTLSVSFRTGQTGRSFRGRLYHIGLCEEQVNGDTLASGVQSGIITAYSAMFDDITTAMPDVLHAVVSYCSNGDWRATAVVTPITTYVVDDTIDSMRRRLLHRGA